MSSERIDFSLLGLQEIKQVPATAKLGNKHTTNLQLALGPAQPGGDRMHTSMSWSCEEYTNKK